MEMFSFCFLMEGESYHHPTTSSNPAQNRGLLFQFLEGILGRTGNRIKIAFLGVLQSS